MNIEFIAHVRKKDDGAWDSPHLLSTHLNKIIRPNVQKLFLVSSNLETNLFAIKIKIERSKNMSKPYEIRFEVQGHAAMFTRPNIGSTPISYPVPTFSASKEYSMQYYANRIFVSIRQGLKFLSQFDMNGT